MRGAAAARIVVPMPSNRKPVLKLGVVDLGVETATLPNGLTLDLAIIRHPGAAAIIALHDDWTVAMLSQYRHAIGGYLWEIPAGCRAPGESGLECARRELAEEARLTAQRWDPLGAIVTIPSFCDERIELFLARGLGVGAGQPDADEVIRVERVLLKDAFKMIRDGRIEDAKTIAALYRARDVLAGE